MILSEETALMIAENLLKVKAVKLNVEEPFTWASGIKSPIYCDNRLTLSYPQIRTFIRQQFVHAITEEFGVPDLIAGVATGAIAQGALVAQELGLPFVYIRSSQKSHGLENKIEGKVESGQSVIVIEDLVSTGGSSLKAVDALRDNGCNVKGMVAIFTYGLPAALENFEKKDVKLLTLSNYDMLIKQAIEGEYIKSEDLHTLMQWKENPGEWK